MRCFEARKGKLKGHGVNGRWMSPLETHLFPKIGNLEVTKIDQIVIRDTLAPIWQTKASTSKKSWQRLKLVLDHAAAEGHDVDMMAAQKAKALLGAQDHKVQHLAAMPWRAIPAFWADLASKSDSPGTLALQLTILTACRSGEVRGLRLGELDGNVWTVPGTRMKSSKQHRVPLSPEAMDVIARVKVAARDGLLFPGRTAGSTISDMTMSAVLRRMGVGVTVYGFRSAFRDWAAETRDEPREIVEMCLAHTVGSAVERSYRRSDFVDRRIKIMTAWAAFVTGETPEYGG